MKKFSAVFCILLMVPFFAAAQYFQKSATGGLVDWTNQVIREIGIGSPNPNMPISAQRAGAIEAAKRVALRNILEKVQGMNIDSDVTIQQFMVSNDLIRNKIRGVIQNFQVIDTRYKSDGSVEVEVEVPLSGIFSTVLPGQLLPPATIQQTPAGTKPPAFAAGYSGLIVDARGLGIKPALAPKLLDENQQQVYGTEKVSRNYALQMGVVGYEKDLNRARSNERVAGNPLVVKAIGASGTHKTDVVVSNKDADLIDSAAQNADFLKQCKVMFILD